jgi:hypothetical protein
LLLLLLLLWDDSLQHMTPSKGGTVKNVMHCQKARTCLLPK